MLTLSTNINNNIPDVSYNDLYRGADGNLATSRDIQAVLQACAQAAQLLLGEYTFDVNIGIPYFQVLWVGVPNVPQFLAALRVAFLNVPNVVEVVSLLADLQNNVLSYSAIIRTTYGVGSFNGTITNG